MTYPYCISLAVPAAGYNINVNIIIVICVTAVMHLPVVQFEFASEHMLLKLGFVYWHVQFSN